MNERLSYIEQIDQDTPGGVRWQVSEAETVKEGVTCTILTPEGNEHFDAAIIYVEPGFSTPSQEVEEDNSLTIEGFVQGSGQLVILHPDGSNETHTIEGDCNFEAEVRNGDEMQWSAFKGGPGLIFYEICYPRYKKGRLRDKKSNLV